MSLIISADAGLIKDRKERLMIYMHCRIRVADSRSGNLEWRLYPKSEHILPEGIPIFSRNLL
jgi:hypothetical protein